MWRCSRPASAQGKTDADGAYRFDLTLPTYFAGRPLNHGAARVLIEATVKDSAGHSETRGEPITVSEIAAHHHRDSGGRHAGAESGEPGLHADLVSGRHAGDRRLEGPRAPGMPTRRATTDAGGVAVIRLQGRRRQRRTLQVEATDAEGNHASSTVAAAIFAQGEDQILLRTERAVYRAGDRIQLKVFSTKRARHGVRRRREGTDRPC